MLPLWTVWSVGAFFLKKFRKKGGCQTEGCLAIMKKVYSNSIKMKYWENSVYSIYLKMFCDISDTFGSIKGKNEFGMMSEWKFFECIMNKIWTHWKTNAEHFAHSEMPKNIWKSIWQMLENVYTVSCKNKGVPFIRSAFLFAVFQFLTYIFQQKAPFPGAFCYEWKE